MQKQNSLGGNRMQSTANTKSGKPCQAASSGGLCFLHANLERAPAKLPEFLGTWQIKRRGISFAQEANGNLIFKMSI